MKLYCANYNDKIIYFIMMDNKVVKLDYRFDNFSCLDELIRHIDKKYYCSISVYDFNYLLLIENKDTEMLLEFSDIKDLVNLKETNPEVFI